jgi:DNA-directed RNA polymerase specialized sigma24 family protein
MTVENTDYGPSPWAALVANSELREALMKLDEQTQRVIYLRYWEMHTIEEIACELRMKWDTADKIISSSLLTMRECLKASRKNKADDAA